MDRSKAVSRSPAVNAPVDGPTREHRSGFCSHFSTVAEGSSRESSLVIVCGPMTCSSTSIGRSTRRSANCGVPLDQSGERRLVETVSKRGYRLAAELNDASRPCSGFVRAATGLPTDAAAYVTGVTCSIGGECPICSPALRVSSKRSRSAAMRRPLRQGSPMRMLKGYEWSWGESELHYRRDLSIDAACASAHHGYAQLLVALADTRKRFTTMSSHGAPIRCQRQVPDLRRRPFLQPVP